jgi:hypothetical protein
MDVTSHNNSGNFRVCHGCNGNRRDASACAFCALCFLRCLLLEVLGKQMSHLRIDHHADVRDFVPPNRAVDRFRGRRVIGCWFGRGDGGQLWAVPTAWVARVYSDSSGADVVLNKFRRKNR